jgi:hypothetical protein
MWYPHTDDRVRLTHDIPELSLHSGEIGVIRSVWFAPASVYEVEFHGDRNGCQVRTLLGERQFEVEQEAALVECGG